MAAQLAGEEEAAARVQIPPSGSSASSPAHVPRLRRQRYRSESQGKKNSELLDGHKLLLVSKTPTAHPCVRPLWRLNQRNMFLATLGSGSACSCMR
ncbi:hypothetical protein SETIT_9G281500v2 [Setaria italica]|uniref:Uncharacterized protein n=1 Tax=Setaria italica TaxID=4555 RepID=A0A368SLK4_SETIT|nr:hypothetical protein SETIT_9G281500v2 [Setaria italica]